MERPTVLLALDGDQNSYVEALKLAGFEVLTDETGVTKRLASGQALDLAVLDCDLAAAGHLYAQLHGATPVPTLLIFQDEPPAYATGSKTHATRDEYALKPVPAEALVCRLEALLVPYNRDAPE